ncbi:hypothetical protein [Streptomyces sp. NPDC002889]|uniref:hypothetical protein n=1 Tax=Streptomyces sp. NPDC002889 TaxID=3364669 RepID=UPI003680B31E
MRSRSPRAPCRLRRAREAGTGRAGERLRPHRGRSLSPCVPNSPAGEPCPPGDTGSGQLRLGACFGTVYEITLGDIGPHESGSASGSLSAVGQLANSIGAAAITTIYFHTSGGSANAAAHSLAVVAAATLLCCALVWLLPRKARPRHH